MLLAVTFGIALWAQSIQSDQAAQERMRQVREVSEKAQEANAQANTQANAIPLWGGPDDDPTLAADVFDHEAPAGAKKLAGRAEKLSKKGRHEEAIEEFKRALAIDPQYYEAANNLGLEYFAAGHPDLAVDTLRQLTKSHSKHVLAFDNLALILCRLQRYSEAEAVAKQAYKMHLFSYKAAYVYGAALVNQGKWTDDAKQALRYSSARHPEAKELLAKWPQK
ncbi:MAG TPA: tetratricopeptide repeat protein [Bryobacteraceae bacterium]|jgi:tetratricopeptide (TPR) repeat protein|nr:tetratricopeptide repeat protein [Bryobacteraceae bacterium]